MFLGRSQEVNLIFTHRKTNSFPSNCVMVARKLVDDMQLLKRKTTTNHGNGRAQLPLFMAVPQCSSAVVDPCSTPAPPAQSSAVHCGPADRRSKPVRELRGTTSAAAAAQFSQMPCGTQFAEERCSRTQSRPLWFSPQSCIETLTRISKRSADKKQVDLRYIGRAFFQRMLFVLFCLYNFDEIPSHTTLVTLVYLSLVFSLRLPS